MDHHFRADGMGAGIPLYVIASNDDTATTMVLHATLSTREKISSIMLFGCKYPGCLSPIAKRELLPKQIIIMKMIQNNFSLLHCHRTQSYGRRL